MRMWLKQPTALFTPDDIAINEDGVHLLFQWSAYPSSAVRHVGEYGVIGTDGLMRTINNTPLPMPVTQGQLAYKPLQPGENPAISDGLKMGIQSAKFAFDGEGLSHITYRFRTVDDPSGTWFSKFGVYVATWAGSAWSEQQIAYVPPERGEHFCSTGGNRSGGQTEGVFFGGIHVFREYCRCHCPGGKCRFWMGLLGTWQQRPPHFCAWDLRQETAVMCFTSQHHLRLRCIAILCRKIIPRLSNSRVLMCCCRLWCN
ncbi:Uncharacterised protein [Klebsiella pneumoniae]|nr:Uncharacterised protein [Klebsiella pneumoniae]